MLKKRLLWSVIVRAFWSVEVLFEPRDLWLGVYWFKASYQNHYVLEVYVCLIPCVPIKVTLYGKKPEEKCQPKQQ